MPEYKKNYGAKKSFASRGAPRSGDHDGPRQMYASECSSCHEACDVPFRPNGKKPIFCSSCFKRDTDQSGGRDTRSPYPKRDFTPSRSFDRPAPVQEDRRIDDLKRQVATLDAKLDTLIQLLGSSRIKESVNVREGSIAESKTPEPAAAKKARAKAAKKN